MKSYDMIGIGSEPEAPVVHESSMPKHPSKMLHLLLARVEPESISHLHKRNVIMVSQNCQQGIASSLPWMNPGVSDARGL